MVTKCWFSGSANLHASCSLCWQTCQFI